MKFLNIFRKDDTKAKAGKLEGIELYQSARRQNVSDTNEPLCYKDRRGNIVCIIDTNNLEEKIAHKADKCYVYAMSMMS
jgi:hypothetical protein